MRNKLKLNKKGFTIIEVMIVLAIAGLILLIVFLAIPALQRAQRNTGRKEDAGRLVTAIGDFISNDGGVLPQKGTWISSPTTTGSCETILNDAGKLNQGTWTSNDCTFKSQGPNNFDLEDGSTASIQATSQNVGFEAILVTSATCTTGSSNSTTPGNSNQAALLYDLETASGNYNWACITAN